MEIDPTKEYLYIHDEIWVQGSSSGIPIKHGTIMHNVKYIYECGRFTFTGKKNGIEYHTYYEWALAENTPENIEYIKIRNMERDKLKKQEKIHLRAYNKIKTLKKPNVDCDDDCDDGDTEETGI